MNPSTFPKRGAFSALLACLFLASAFAQEENYPVAMPTDQPGIVMSPFDSGRQLDVEGLEPGSLAMDPIANQVFRIPYASLSQGGIEDYLGRSMRQPTPDLPARDRSAVAPPTQETPVPPHQYPRNNLELPQTVQPSWQSRPGQIPEDLLAFLYEFNHLSSSNDPAALLPFYANPVPNYFGKHNIGHQGILDDRAAYIRRFPKRTYLLAGEPVLLSSGPGEYEILARIDYAVAGSGKRLSGSVSDSIRIRQGRSGYEIVSIEEAKAQKPIEPVLTGTNPTGTNPTGTISTGAIQPGSSPTEVPALSPAPGGPVGEPGVYDWYQRELMERFLEAFTASGEVNDPAACVAFMHPAVETYYSMRNPNRDQLLGDRARYIERWPERRYWLTEKPRLRALPDGTWEAVSSVGYEVRSVSRNQYRSGVATSVARLAFAPDGLKIVSIREE